MIITDIHLNLPVCFYFLVVFISTHTRKFFVSIQPPVGELMMPAFLTENEFKKEQGEMIRSFSDSNVHQFS